MGLQEATNAADAVYADNYKGPKCLVAYQYTRGCYAVIVVRDDATLVLVDGEAVRMYRANYRRDRSRLRDAT